MRQAGGAAGPAAHVLARPRRPEAFGLPGRLVDQPGRRRIGGLRTPPERRKTPAQGAATSVPAGAGGRYFEDRAEAPVVGERPPLFGGGVAPYALDPGNAERLWTVATGLVS